MRNKRVGARARGYTRDWDIARSNYLVFNPWCVMCNQIATVVDHIVPHKGSMTLFWDKANWQSLCRTCHSSTKQSIEHKGYDKAIGVDGWPTDARHPANKKGHRGGRKSF
jgi:5-methylcytosine-specific restriction protein A